MDMDINQSSEEKLNHEDSFVIVDNRIQTTAARFIVFDIGPDHFVAYV